MRRKLLFISLIIILFVTACSKEKNDVGENGSKENAIENKNDILHNMYPLTGMKTNEEVTDRIISVMVNNHSKARPQSGLSKADIVFEILAEGNTTRFLALYQSEQPEVVGPVRSARQYYFDLASNYDALYVYHGAAKFVDEMILSRGIENLNGATYDNDENLFKREAFRKAPHNSYLQFAAVYPVAEEKGYDIIHTYESLPFLDEDEAVEGDDTAHVVVAYPGRSSQNVVEYKYDAASELYTRYENQIKTVELDTEEAIAVDNVFIIETHHEVIDKEGRRSVDLESGGEAYLIQKGIVKKVKWENEQGRIIPTKDGKPVGFVPGKTWINIIPTNPGIEQSVELLNE